jgi:hypothetical protein
LLCLRTRKAYGIRIEGSKAGLHVRSTFQQIVDCSMHQLPASDAARDAIENTPDSFD